MNSNFKELFYHLDEQLDQTENDLSKESKKRLTAQVKFHIFLQEFLKKVEPLLDEGEEIKGYLPFSPGPNSSMANVGVMGMAYARTKEARGYVNTFNDVRGNRLMIFTEKRMIFMTIIEFLEDEIYFSYPYESIESIRLKQHTVSYFDWEKRFSPKRVKIHWYTFDFQSGKNIFTEMLDEKDAQLLREKMESIPPLKAILITDKVKRSTTFDFLFSNVSLQFKVVIVLFLLLAAILLIFGYVVPLLKSAAPSSFEIGFSQLFRQLFLNVLTLLE